MELDGKKIVNNIYSKAKELDIKIGDIEKEVPVSLGYFSRFLKDDNHSLPSLESLYVAASKLNVTIDFLLSCNYSDMNEEELLVQEKLSIMILNTTKEKYRWTEVREKEFSAPIHASKDNVFHANHPLAKLYPHYDAFGDTDYVVQDYYSYFLDDTLLLDGSIFSIKLDSGTFYISRVIQEGEYNHEKITFYEFYIVMKIANVQKIFKIANACAKDKFYGILEELYKTCVLKSQEFKLELLAKNALESIK